MSQAKNTLTYAQLLELELQDLLLMAEESLDVEADYEVEEILQAESFTDEDIELIADFIIRCQNLMPH